MSRVGLSRPSRAGYGDPMDMDDLQALIWASEHGSIMAASKASGVARATLRRRLERVEDHLGRKALVTGTDGITLTAAGLVLVSDGLELLAARDRMVRRARSVEARDSVLRVLVEQFHPPAMLAGMIRSFTEMLPGIRTEVVFDASPAARSLDHFDAIVHIGDRPLLADGTTRVLLRLPLRVQASRAYLEARGTPTESGDLVDHAVLHRAGAPSSWPLLVGGELVISPLHSCSDLFTLGLMAAEGMGLALLPRPEVSVHPALDALVPVMEDVIQAEQCVRIDMPMPSSEHSAAARVIALFEQL